MRLSLRRRGVVVVLAALAVAGIAAVRSDAGHQTTVASYTGCLKTAQGALSRFAVGDSSLSPCPSDQVAVHVSSGDITSVTAGTGLSGTATQGNASLDVDFADFGSCAEGSAIRGVGVTATCQSTFYGYELVSTPYSFSNSTGSNVIAGDSAICPDGKRVLGGGYSRSLGPNDPVVQFIDQSLREDLPPDSAHAGFNVNVVLQPGQSVSGHIQAVCAFVD